MTALSPAESLFLLKPNRTAARETVKVTLLSLIAQGLVRLDEQVTKRFIGSKKTVYVRPTAAKVPALPAHAASLLAQVRAAQARSGTMDDLVKLAREAYGASLTRFNRDFIVPRLKTRRLLDERRFLFVPYYKRTPAGDVEESRIAADIARARTIPELIRSNPAEAAAIVLAVGSTILLVSELRPYYRQISEAMRAPPGADGSADSGGGEVPPSFWDSSKPGAEHSAHPHDALQQLDAASLGNLDLSSFDAGAFDALDAGMASFDAGFDASVGDSGGGGGGDGGGGGGGD
jgi:hypothetical protein